MEINDRLRDLAARVDTLASAVRLLKDDVGGAHADVEEAEDFLDTAAGNLRAAARFIEECGQDARA